MKCPDCGEVMEREDGATTKDVAPNCIYSCEECGSEFKWTKGVKGLKRLSEGLVNAAVAIERSRY